MITNVNEYCQAQHHLNSTQPQLKLRMRLALFPPDPPTHPFRTVDSTLHYFMIIQDLFKDASMLLKKYFKAVSTPHQDNKLGL